MMKLAFATILLLSSNVAQGRFTCPIEPFGGEKKEPLGVYYSVCEGNNVVFSFGTCPGELEVETEPCSEYADNPSFRYCHECSGHTVCSSSQDKGAVCTDVSSGRCSTVDYEVDMIGCLDQSNNGDSYTICKDGVATPIDPYPESCANTFDRQDLNQCLQCDNDSFVCAPWGVTCRDVALPQVASSGFSNCITFIASIVGILLFSVLG